MIPRGAEAIQHIRTRILTDLLPKASDAYTGADLAMIGEMISLVAQDYDRAADVLVADDADLRAIFLEALKLIGDETLKRRISAVLASRPEGLRIRELSAHADQMMRVLIDLQAAVEVELFAGAESVGVLDRTIWRFLDNYVARRTYESTF